MRKYTIFTIKKDALAKGLAKEIISDLERFYDVVAMKRMVIDSSIVALLKEGEWQNNWKPYPDEHVKELCYVYESGEVMAILCRIKIEEDAINFGKRLKGNHHLAHLCSPDTIRGKYADLSVVDSIYTDENMVSYLCDKDNNKISSVPNIIHAVDNDIELNQHLSIYFKDIDLSTM